MYKCVNSACGRGMPRPVAFCPYCGVRQAAAPSRPAPAAAVPVAAPVPPPVPVPVLVPVPPPAAVAQAVPEPAAPPLKPKVDLGPKPLHIPPLEPDNATSRKPSPPPRQPIRMRTWLMALAALTAIWLFAKPGDTAKKNADRVDVAVALAAECKMVEARAELAALKSAKAAPAQLKRLQSAISETTPGCEKKRLRAAAWNDTRGAVETALDGGSPDKAASRLAAFTRRWDADADTRELSDKIELKKAERLLDEADACLAKSDRGCLENRLLAAERLKRPELLQRTQALRESLSRLLESSLLGTPSAAPAAAPPPAALNNEPPRAAAPAPSRVISTAPAPSSQTGQQVRKILSDAERELAQGNYRGAIDKLDICATMIDVGNRDCLVLKQRAERLNRDMLRCVAGGADWVNDRCN
ncbi:hypothetical protein ACFDR9_001785 [Janthinobacterium sp. CG_23.3]|uniref:hypothetical protein n=1 Tax=Janthinobacterium sp. CG_23.3 TaxID=3349634 RepID=UPI0038D3B818